MRKPQEDLPDPGVRRRSGGGERRGDVQPGAAPRICQEGGRYDGVAPVDSFGIDHRDFGLDTYSILGCNLVRLHQVPTRSG